MICLQIGLRLIAEYKKWSILSLWLFLTPLNLILNMIFEYSNGFLSYTLHKYLDEFYYKIVIINNKINKKGKNLILIEFSF